MMKLKRFVLLLSVLSFFIGVRADDVHHVLRIILTEGAVQEFDVSSRPVVTLTKDSLLIVTEEMSVSYAADEVQEHRFADIETSGIEDVKMDLKNGQDFRVVCLDGIHVTVFGNMDAKDVQVYGVNGMRQPVAVEHLGDRLDFSLEHLRSGVYVVALGNKKSFKVYRR